MADSVIPPDDPARALVHARPDDPALPHVAVAGGTYTILVAGEQTAGRYCLIDMRVPPGGGPPPHRHDFEEMFTVLDGAVEFTFRGERIVARAGETVNIPANAPHFFRNSSDEPVRMLCMCTPAGQDEFFLRVGDRVDGPTTPAPKLDEAQRNERGERAGRLAAEYRTEMLIP
ncbi:cupin domain-containing protein [Micromonospora sp. NBC_01796]|uniref:cupin domain-containing protein n=1 Tax=Micromonospora sp. NBC_01796 TaxID=2975987 RepID=UPI002DD9FE72|nr:cupin domain-containing protein [Micromonospora sp. NBC_01796]WSA84292.1 cupin domain-containing protein [Micromonospora sp. NBC_01796]